MVNQIYFQSPSSGIVSTTQMVRDITEFVNTDPTNFYRLVIGTDSQAKRINGEGEIDFVTAIVVHRIGKGAKYYWRKEKKPLKFPADTFLKAKLLRDKIYTETLMSLDVAQLLVPLVRKNISPKKYDMEIHIDVGSIGPTREMIKEVVGMVNGNGFTAKTKPESWGASTVADRYT